MYRYPLAVTGNRINDPNPGQYLLLCSFHARIVAYACIAVFIASGMEKRWRGSCLSQRILWRNTSHHADLRNAHVSS